MTYKKLYFLTYILFFNLRINPIDAGKEILLYSQEVAPVLPSTSLLNLPIEIMEHIRSFLPLHAINNYSQLNHQIAQMNLWKSLKISQSTIIIDFNNIKNQQNLYSLLRNIAAKVHWCPDLLSFQFENVDNLNSKQVKKIFKCINFNFLKSLRINFLKTVVHLEELQNLEYLKPAEMKIYAFPNDHSKNSIGVQHGKKGRKIPITVLLQWVSL